MNKKKGVFSKGLIVFIIFMILGYAVADFYMQYSLGVQFNDTFASHLFVSRKSRPDIRRLTDFITSSKSMSRTKRLAETATLK